MAEEVMGFSIGGLHLHITFQFMLGFFIGGVIARYIWGKGSR